jgi:hypothetical protein
MENVLVPAARWLGLAEIATPSAIWSRLSTVLAVIVVDTVAQLVIVQSRSRAKSFLTSNKVVPLVFIGRADPGRSGLMRVRRRGTTATQRTLCGICHGTYTALGSLSCVVGEATPRLAMKNDSE